MCKWWGYRCKRFPRVKFGHIGETYVDAPLPQQPILCISNMEREYNYFRDEDDYGNLDLVEVFSEEEGFQDNLDADTLKLLKSFK